MVSGVRQVMYLLDTVAISEGAILKQDRGYADFIQGTSPDSKLISVASIAELRYGLNLLPDGKRKVALESWVETTEQEFSDRTLEVEGQRVIVWGTLRAGMQKQGFTIAYNDLLISATAQYYDLTVVTRNVRDFAPTGCKLFNPWEPTS